MTEIMKFHDSVLMTIPGIGYINGGMTLGDIRRFSCPAKLQAFAGLDPPVYQSGKSPDALQCSWALWRQTCQNHLEDAH